MRFRKATGVEVSYTEMSQATLTSKRISSEHVKDVENQPPTYIGLSIAGSDPSGGAGIQADLKTFSALGVYGATVITALTAQNTLGVSSVWQVPTSVVEQQLSAVLADLAVGVIKLGMLHNQANVELIVQYLRAHPHVPVVCDPVIASSSGAALLSPEGVDFMRSHLLPLVSVLTPNLHEAASLLQTTLAKDENEMISQAEGLQEITRQAVLLTGGHLDSAQAIDVLVWAEHGMCRCEVFRVERITTKNTHGTGCTLSSAIAAGLVKNMSVNDAVAMAKEYVTHALTHADTLHVGTGTGPLQHFYQ